MILTNLLKLRIISLIGFFVSMHDLFLVSACLVLKIYLTCSADLSRDFLSSTWLTLLIDLAALCMLGFMPKNTTLLCNIWNVNKAYYLLMQDFEFECTIYLHKEGPRILSKKSTWIWVLLHRKVQTIVTYYTSHPLFLVDWLSWACHR